MTRDPLPLALAIALLLLLPQAAGAEPDLPQARSIAQGSTGTTQPVSPAGRVELACPTFSWAAAAGARGHELVVYAVEEDGEVGEEPLLSVRLPGGASSWTPAGAECFGARGRFAWSVRVVGERGQAGWSAPMLFEVAAQPSVAEVRAALETLRRYLARSREGGPADAAAAELNGTGGPPSYEPPAARQPLPRAGRPVAGGNSGSPDTLSTRSAPSLGSPALTLDGTVALGGESHLFKDGAVFLWDSAAGNTALGRLALGSADDTATQNTAVGTGALTATTATPTAFQGSRNTAVGYLAMTSNTTGFSNAAVGDEALTGNVGGSLNTAIGHRALFSNTSGHRNTASGALALEDNLGGAWNTAVGGFALRNNTSGDSNTALGYKALHQATGSGNVAIGFNAGLHATDGSDNVFIAHAGGSEDFGTIRIGSTEHDRAYIGGIHGEPVSSSLNEMTVLVDSSGKLGTQISSRRFKEGIAGVGEASRRLLELRPVRFRYKEQEGQGPEQFGLLAEEVAEVFPDLVVRDAGGRPLSVRYHVLAPLLLAELQRAHREIEVVRKELAIQREELEALRRRTAPGEP